MKGKRYLTSQEVPHVKDEHGKPLCRWCRTPVTPPRRSWCSDGCVKEYLIRSSAETLRRAVFERDKGVCACCGADTDKIRRIATFDNWYIFKAMGFNDRYQSLWEADHILEVVNGGETSLDNMQTLCVPCHKAKTKRMHAERAQARRDQKRGLLEATA